MSDKTFVSGTGRITFDSLRDLPSVSIKARQAALQRDNMKPSSVSSFPGGVPRGTAAALKHKSVHPSADDTPTLLKSAAPSSRSWILPSLSALAVAAMVAMVVIITLVLVQTGDNQDDLDSLESKVLQLDASIALANTTVLSSAVDSLGDRARNLTEITNVLTGDIHDVLLEINASLPCDVVPDLYSPGVIEYNETLDTFLFKTSSEETIFTAAAGLFKVGSGTNAFAVAHETAPTSDFTLDVYGEYTSSRTYDSKLRLFGAEASGYTNLAQLHADASEGAFVIDSQGALTEIRMQTGSSNALRIDSAQNAHFYGNVGVGVEPDSAYQFRVRGAETYSLVHSTTTGAYHRIWASEDDTAENACLSLASKTGETSTVPDNSWYMCNHRRSHEPNWAPSLQIGFTVNKFEDPDTTSDQFIISSAGVAQIKGGNSGTYSAISTPSVYLGTDGSKSGGIRLYGTIAGDSSTIQQTDSNLHIDTVNTAKGIYFQFYSDSYVHFSGPVYGVPHNFPCITMTNVASGSWATSCSTSGIRRVYVPYDVMIQSIILVPNNEANGDAIAFVVHLDGAGTAVWASGSYPYADYVGRTFTGVDIDVDAGSYIEIKFTTGNSLVDVDIAIYGVTRL